ncbi:MAG: hypothetical protein M3479_11275 [Actinomycetota bacterium]|jgi:hypothetical protein|nr:hypothetical protein [Actinomycetota bacterium]
MHEFGRQRKKELVGQVVCDQGSVQEWTTFDEQAVYAVLSPQQLQAETQVYPSIAVGGNGQDPDRVVGLFTVIFRVRALGAENEDFLGVLRVPYEVLPDRDRAVAGHYHGEGLPGARIVEAKIELLGSHGTRAYHDGVHTGP